MRRCARPRVDRERHDSPPERDKESKAREESIPEGELIYRAVRQDGDDTLARTSSALAWSGVAAGLGMGFSLAAEGLLKAHLPDATWAPLISKFGYTVGFLIVVLGRQELFTEQTLSAVCRCWRATSRMRRCRTWLVSGR
jgi:formate-nitrite transporter family protein